MKITNEAFLYDFCPDAFKGKFNKKVERVLYSVDRQYWRGGQSHMQHGNFWVTGKWQQFRFYDGSLSAIYPVPVGGQIVIADLRHNIFGGGGWF